MDQVFAAALTGMETVSVREETAEPVAAFAPAREKTEATLRQ